MEHEFARTDANGTILELGDDPVELATDRSRGQLIVTLVQPHVVGDRINTDAKYVEVVEPEES